MQPNHPTDDVAGIAASIVDGLLQTPSRFVGKVMDHADAPSRVHFPGVLVEKGAGEDDVRLVGSYNFV